MLPEDIDDLFRQKLAGHATPPGADLWARLPLPPAHPAAEATPDGLFQAGLSAHATPPRRELWERLEDERLRPPRRQRRVAVWWQYSAAVVLLLLLAGGAGLWRGGFLSRTGGKVAAASYQLKVKSEELRAADQLKNADKQLVKISKKAGAEKNAKYLSAQATAAAASASSTPIATTTRPRRPATAMPAVGSHRAQGRQPDAAAGPLATARGRKTPASQRPAAAPVAAAATVAPAPRDQAEAPTPALAASPSKVATPEIIEVEVRRGAAPTPPVPAEATLAQAAPTPARRPRLRLSGLLRQADHLAHGEPVSLAEATGLPETVTVQARLAGRLLSKTIQL